MLRLNNDSNGNDTGKITIIITNEGLKHIKCFVIFPSDLASPLEVESLNAPILQMKEPRRKANCVSKSHSCGR